MVRVNEVFVKWNMLKKIDFLSRLQIWLDKGYRKFKVPIIEDLLEIVKDPKSQNIRGRVINIIKSSVLKGSSIISIFQKFVDIYPNLTISEKQSLDNIIELEIYRAKSPDVLKFIEQILRDKKLFKNRFEDALTKRSAEFRGFVKTFYPGELDQMAQSDARVRAQRSKRTFYRNGFRDTDTFMRKKLR